MECFLIYKQAQKQTVRQVQRAGAQNPHKWGGKGGGEMLVRQEREGGAPRTDCEAWNGDFISEDIW